jgi:hypothetical protein
MRCRLLPASSFEGVGYRGEFLVPEGDTKGAAGLSSRPLSRGPLLPSYYLADFFAAVVFLAAGLAATVFLAAAGLAAAVFLAAAGLAELVFFAAAFGAAALGAAPLDAAAFGAAALDAAAFGAALFLAAAALGAAVFFAAAFGAALGAEAFLAAGLAAVVFLAGVFEALFVAIAMISPFDLLPSTLGDGYSAEVTPQDLGCQEILHSRSGIAQSHRNIGGYRKALGEA